MTQIAEDKDFQEVSLEGGKMIYMLNGDNRLITAVVTRQIDEHRIEVAYENGKREQLLVWAASNVWHSSPTAAIHTRRALHERDIEIRNHSIELMREQVEDYKQLIEDLNEMEVDLE